MKKLIKKAEKLALSEIKKYNAPSVFNFNLSNKKGQLLAGKYKARKDIVLLGTVLMDLKIGQALSENRLKEHIKLSSTAAKNFLEKEINDKKIIETILNCVEAHHGTIKYESKEAEIVANADCYRFLTINGFLRVIADFSREGMPFNEAIKLAEEKAEEKWSIISLPEAKNELEPDYKLIKNLINRVKKG